MYTHQLTFKQMTKNSCELWNFCSLLSISLIFCFSDGFAKNIVPEVKGTQWLSGLECLTETKGPQVRASPVSLRCSP